MEDILKSETLDTILAPMDRETFLAEHFGKGVLHLAGTPGRFAPLMPWDTLNQILASQRLAAPRLQVIRSGREIPSDQYQHSRAANQRINAGALSLHLSEGATLLLAFVDEIVPGIAALSDSIADALKAHVNANLYAGWRKDNGFGIHWDPHDVLVLQISGRKHWRVHRPAYPDPLESSRFVAPPKDDIPVWDDVLEDGALLYVPRGWAHVATPLDEPSLHITIAVRSPNGADFLRWVMKDLERDAGVRADLPCIDARAAGASDRLDAMRARVAGAIDAAAMERFVLSWEGEKPARPMFTLPAFANRMDAAPGASSSYRLAGQRRLAMMPGSDAGSRVILANGREWPTSVAVAEAITSLTSSQASTLEALHAGLDEAQRSELETMLRMLVRVGSVYVTA